MLAGLKGLAERKLFCTYKDGKRYRCIGCSRMGDVRGEIMKEIVGAKIGTMITNNRKTIAEAVERCAVTEWLDRKRMRFMAGMDLGRNWELMANGPTLFCLDDDGKPHAPNGQAQGRAACGESFGAGGSAAG